jgi:putative transposase
MFDYTNKKTRKEMIELDSKEISLYRQCELLNISRFSLYYPGVEPKQEDIFIMNCIDEIHNDLPGFGVALINDRLDKKYGIKIGLKRTQTYLEIMVISEGEGVYSHTYYPYLLKKLNIDRPNQVWSIDISYIGLMYDFSYLVVVIDWFSRYVVSWELSHTLEVDFVIQAVKRAIDKYGNPDILNVSVKKAIT